MIKLRGKPWFRFLSMLLLATLAQAQAAGCCKWGSRFHSAGVTSALPGSGSAAHSADAGPATLEHACCRKAAAGEAPSGSASQRVPGGCCLKDAGLNAASLASVTVFPGAHPLPAAFAPLPGTLPSALSSRFAVLARGSGPPLSVPSLPLLI